MFVYTKSFAKNMLHSKNNTKPIFCYVCLAWKNKYIMFGRWIFFQFFLMFDLWKKYFFKNIFYIIFELQLRIFFKINKIFLRRKKIKISWFGKYFIYINMGKLKNIFQKMFSTKHTLNKTWVIYVTINKSFHYHYLL